jgi:arylformamidase
VNLTDISMSAHTGTHMDAPAHFIKEGKTIDEIGFKHLIGKAKVLDFSDKEYYIDATDLENKGIEKGDIVLLKTKNSERLLETEYFYDYVYLTEEAAAFLTDKQVATVGLDFLTIDAPETPDYPCHYILLGQEIVIIEGLNLSEVSAGEYWMIALPMKIMGADGAPARVLLKKAMD